MDDMSTEIPPPDGAADTVSGGDAGDDAPNGMERGLVLRLLSHWRELVGERQYPSFSELDPESIPDITGHADDPIFRVAGPKYAAYLPIDLRNLPISKAPRDSLIEKSVAFAQEIIAKQVPISRGGEFMKPGGGTVLYRGIILPMSDDGITVSRLLGAANCREEKV